MYRNTGVNLAKIVHCIYNKELIAVESTVYGGCGQELLQHINVKIKKFKKVLAINKRTTYNYFLSDGLSPSGKATDSDSVIT